MADLQCPHCGETLPTDFIQKRKRRWRTFSVRTLLVTLTILCVWLGWEMSIVRERTSLIAKVNADGGECWSVEHSAELNDGRIETGWERWQVSRVRRLLGDSTWITIILKRQPDPEFLKRLEKAFPEAEIDAYRVGNPFNPFAREELHRLRKPLLDVPN
jgi:hypothetical protein